MSQGPEAGLALIEQLDGTRSLEGYYLLPAAKADLLRRLGRKTQASREYRRARDLAPTEVEERYLSKRLAETSPASSPEARQNRAAAPPAKGDE